MLDFFPLGFLVYAWLGSWSFSMDLVIGASMDLVIGASMDFLMSGASMDLVIGGASRAGFYGFAW